MTHFKVTPPNITQEEYTNTPRTANTMKHTSKTIQTLQRLTKRSVSGSFTESAAVPDLREEQNVIQFNPDELEPLKLDEADEVQLTKFFEDHDFSFLFEGSSLAKPRNAANSTISWADEPLDSSNRKHRIPLEDDQGREKRQRLN